MTTAEPVTVTDRAAAHILKALATEAAGSMLRVSVNGGGCSGFQYEILVRPGPAAG